jgi:aminomethyltransferase
MKKTALNTLHHNLKAKLVDFAGWELPIYFSEVIAEHNWVREKVGLFDVSHMGEISVSGSNALNFLDYLSCNEVLNLKDGEARYTAFLNFEGGVIDDLIIYRLSADNIFLCVNAANTAAVFEWLISQNQDDVKINNLSSDYSQIALQGFSLNSLLSDIPYLQSNLSDCRYFGFKILDLAIFPFASDFSERNIEIIAARTGYTGEDGFEFFLPNRVDKSGKFLAERFAELLLAHPLVKPIGLGARDTLRLEACYPLHGNELSTSKNALASGLSWAVKFTTTSGKEREFIGKKGLQLYKENLIRERLVGFELIDSGIARSGDQVFSDSGELLGKVTSGTRSPTLQKSIGLMQILTNKFGKDLFIKVRGRHLKAQVSKTPFYSNLKVKN